MINLAAAKLVWVLVMFTPEGYMTFGVNGIFHDRSVCQQVVDNLTPQIPEMEAARGDDIDILGFECMPAEMQPTEE